MQTQTEMRPGLASQCCESVHSRGIGLRINTEVQCKEVLVIMAAECHIQALSQADLQYIAIGPDVGLDTKQF